MKLDGLVGSMMGTNNISNSKIAHIEEVYAKLAVNDTSLTKEQIAYMLYGKAGLELMGVSEEEYKVEDTPMGKGISFIKKDN